MFPARLLKTLRSHVYDTRAAAIIPHRGKGVRPIIPRLSARICDRRGLIPPDTERYAFLLSLSLFTNDRQWGGILGIGVFGKISRSLRRLGSSAARRWEWVDLWIRGWKGQIEISNRRGGGELWRRYVKESRGGISRKNRENLPYYKSINLYLLELFLKRLKFKSWELSLRVQIPLRNSQLCTFIMLIIIIILATIKYIFLKSTFRNYWNIITCF